MKIITLTQTTQAKALDQACSILKNGGLVVYPTETMYGVGADALCQAGVTAVLGYKNRPAGKAISVLVANQEMAETYVTVSPSAKNAYTALLPGPVTVISKDKGLVDARLCSELGTLGIRISAHPFAATLATRYGRPITATSANPAGGARPYSIKKLLAQLSDKQKEKIDLIIDAGELPHTEPSTVIDTTGEVQEVVRAGAAVHLVAPLIQTYSEEETMEQAARMVRQFEHVLSEKPLIFALEGAMGMGKTQFAKGVATALLVKEIVSSPTYALMKEYNGSCGGAPVSFIHIDCWRGQHITPEELELQHYLHPHVVMVIEWATPLIPWLKDLGNSIVTQEILFTETGETARSLQIMTL